MKRMFALLLTISLLAPAYTFAASCSVTFDTNPITSGESTTIRWTSSEAEWMYINGIGYVQSSGSAVVQPSQTTSYNGEVGHTVTPQGGTGGAQTYTTPGTHSFSIPANYGSLTVEVWGGGGGGRGGFHGTGNGGAGGASSFNGTLLANGGGGGVAEKRRSIEFEEFGGAGGTASGGDINTSGTAGESRLDQQSGLTTGGRGGNSGNSGTGGTGGPNPPAQSGQAGGYPGGAGGGASSEAPAGAGGGGGGYARKVYAAGQLSGNVTVVVGNAGAAGLAGATGGLVDDAPGGAGAAGRVVVSWTGGAGSGDPVDVTDATCQATLTVAAPPPQCPSGQTWNGTVCVSSGPSTCPTGFSGTPPSCTFSGCPAEFELQGGQCVPIQGPQCQQFYCVGNDLYENNAQCAGSLVQACAFGCSGGVCIAPPPGGGNITATPTLLQSGGRTTVSWTATDVEAGSCSVFEDNPSISDIGTGSSNSFLSSPILQQTIFTLACIGLDGEPFIDKVTVRIIPTFQEQ